MNDFKSKEYKSETVFLLTGEILLHQKYYLDFQSSLHQTKDLHYQAINRQ